MKILFLLMGIAVCVVCYSATAQAQWTQTSGPGGGVISAITSSGADLYVATGTTNGTGYGGGMYHSTDNGSTWIALDYPITKRDDRNISSIVVSGSNIVAGTLKGIVFSSTDGGSNWTRTQMPTNKNVTSLTSDGTNFYAGTDGGGVFKAAIGSTSWLAANTGLTSQRVTALLVNGSDLFATTAFGGVPLFKSTDGAASWALDSMPSSVFNAFAIGINSGKMFVGAQNGVHVSTNNGASWTGPISGISFAVYSFAFSGSTVYTGTSSGFYSMPLTGSSWTSVTSAYGVTALCATASGLYMGATTQSGMVNNGIKFSTNGGTTWSDRSAGIAATTIHSLLATDSLLFALTKGQGLYVSADNGATWSLSTANAAGYDAQSQNLGLKDGILFASSSTGLLTSTNNGASWTASSPGFTPQAFYTFGAKLFAGENGGIRVSTNDGATWSVANTGLTGYLSTNCFGSKGNALYAGLYSSGFYVSTDSGANWTPQNTGLQSQRIRSIAVLGNKIFVATDDRGVSVSNDDGASWTTKNSGLTSQNAWSLAERNGVLFLATNDGVFVSQDSAETWTGTTPSSYIANAVTVKGSDVFCGTLANGVWSTPVSGIVTSVREISGGEFPATFALTQNYPNPFNPITNIGFHVAEQGMVTITVYDMLGRELETLLSKEMQAGNYSIDWNASHYPSGVYYYRMTAISSRTNSMVTDTKSMVLAK